MMAHVRGGAKAHVPFNRQNKRQKRYLLEESKRVYQPKTKETQAAYEAMLSVIQQQLGCQPSNIISGAADEILAVLKNDTLSKKKDMEKFLNPIPNELFDQLVSIGRLITDYQDTANAQDALDDDLEFEEDDEETDEKDMDDDDSHQRNVVENGERKLLDLESIAFEDGGHLIANKMCRLPLGSYRSFGEGYEGVHVPPLKPKPLAPDEMLVKISTMPSWAQPAFEGMEELNRVQSKVYEIALFKADNLLVSAPTGSGKTNVAILTILQQIGLHMNEDGSFNNSDYKIVYIAPMKSLVAQVVGNLSNRLKHYGVSVIELSGTGDVSLIEETQIIVTTPENWDIITRKSGYTKLVNVKLVIIDEVLKFIFYMMIK